MSRFFFHFYDGTTLSDEDGTELSDASNARVHAIHFAGELIKEGAKLHAFGEDWRMEVTDERGLVLFMLDFNVVAAPAVSTAASGH